MFNKIKGAFSLWNVIRAANTSELSRQVAMPVSLALIAEDDQFEALSARLGASVVHQRVKPGERLPDGEGVIVLDASKLLGLSDADFSASLAKIAIRHADRRIALAAQVPAFRLVVVSQLSHDRAFENARVAAISALPGIIPLTDWLLPAASAGDLFVLTKNQVRLLLEVAACYGKPPDIRARIKELLPVVGGAFGWRAIARELIGLVPGGVGVAVKAAVAYAGTYSVGRSAAYYYAGNGRAMTAEQFRSVYRGALTDAYAKMRGYFSRK